MIHFKLKQNILSSGFCFQDRPDCGCGSLLQAHSHLQHMARNIHHIHILLYNILLVRAFSPAFHLIENPKTLPDFTNALQILEASQESMQSQMCRTPISEFYDTSTMQNACFVPPSLIESKFRTRMVLLRRCGI